MPANSVAVVNEALQFISNQGQITSFADGSQAAQAASVLYAPTVQLLLWEIQPDFARFTGPLTLSAATTPIPPWAYEYLYPATMIRLRQVRPPTSGTGALADLNDPEPIRANVAFDLIAGTTTKVILTNQPNALAVYTSSTITETAWDAAFTEAVVRRLANPLAMALAGRPDYAREVLQQAAVMAQTTENTLEGGFRH